MLNLTLQSSLEEEMLRGDGDLSAPSSVSKANPRDNATAALNAAYRNVSELLFHPSNFLTPPMDDEVNKI